MGSHHTGEAFGEDFVLPPDRAYSETCAGIASMMLAWRLLLATGEPRFADLFERTLHNVVATSPAPDGRHFFYANPLHQRTPGAVPPEDEESRRAGTSLRAPWFLVACCPTNVARTLASLAAYLATADERRDPGPPVRRLPDPHDARRWSPRRRRRGDRLPGRRHRHRARRGDRRRTVGAHVAGPGVGVGRRARRRRRPPAGVPGRGRRRAPVPAGRRGHARAADGAALDAARPTDRRRARVRRRRAGTAGDVRRVGRPARRPSRRRAARRSVRAAPRRRRLASSWPGRLVEPADRPWPYGADEDEPTRRRTPSTSRSCPYHTWANRGPSTMRVWIPTTDPRARLARRDASESETSCTQTRSARQRPWRSTPNL